MTTAEIHLTDDDLPQLEAFAERTFMAGLAAAELTNIELGLRLGLYDALAGADPVTPGELAERAGIHARYAREWLEQQTVAGVLDVEDAAEAPDRRRFSLPNAHAAALLDPDSEACMAPIAGLVPWVSKALDIMTTEFRTGTGVAFGNYGLHDLQAAFTRPVFATHLVQSWLPALPEVQANLEAGQALRIAEVGCGEGLAAITIAKAYPEVTIDAWDLDDASIAAARKAAADTGVADRVRFEVRDCADVELGGDYDLVLSIEMLHDVPDPVGVLRAMRALAANGGEVLLVEERTEDAFTPGAGEMERLFYAFSTLHCLAVSMQDGGAGTGTVIRRDTVERYVAEAGFASLEDLDVEHPQFRLYRVVG
jgi:2-polyprenyl-3-methyl-5-hydroxy-6-metoxy-1,4-benzoquinol methylase